MLWFSRAFLVVAFTPALALAHGLDCNLPPLTIEDGVEENFIVQTSAGSGASWGELDGCGEQNHAGGSGRAACLRHTTTTLPVDASLQSLEFFLPCLGRADLSFDTYFARHGNEGARFFVEALPDGSTNWVQILEWSDDHEGGGLGERVTLSLAAFSVNGFSPVSVRWRVVAPAAALPEQAVVAQVDNVSLVCEERPNADLDVSAPVQTLRLSLLEQRPLNVRLLNFGSFTSPGAVLRIRNLGGAQLFGPSASGTHSELTLPVPALVDGGENVIPFAVAAIRGGGATAARVEIRVEGQLCDWRLNNNAVQLALPLPSLEQQRQFEDLAARVLVKVSLIRRRIRGHRGLTEVLRKLERDLRRVSQHVEGKTAQYFQRAERELRTLRVLPTVRSAVWRRRVLAVLLGIEERLE